MDRATELRTLANVERQISKLNPDGRKRVVTYLSDLFHQENLVEHSNGANGSTDADYDAEADGAKASAPAEVVDAVSGLPETSAEQHADGVRHG